MMYACIIHEMSKGKLSSVLYRHRRGLGPFPILIKRDTNYKTSVNNVLHIYISIPTSKVWLKKRFHSTKMSYWTDK